MDTEEQNVSDPNTSSPGVSPTSSGEKVSPPQGSSPVEPPVVSPAQASVASEKLQSSTTASVGPEGKSPGVQPPEQPQTVDVSQPPVSPPIQLSDESLIEASPPPSDKKQLLLVVGIIILLIIVVVLAVAIFGQGNFLNIGRKRSPAEVPPVTTSAEQPTIVDLTPTSAPKSVDETVDSATKDFDSVLNEIDSALEGMDSDLEEGDVVPTL